MDCLPAFFSYSTTLASCANIRPDPQGIPLSLYTALRTTSFDRMFRRQHTPEADPFVRLSCYHPFKICTAGSIRLGSSPLFYTAYEFNRQTRCHRSSFAVPSFPQSARSFVVRSVYRIGVVQYVAGSGGGRRFRRAFCHRPSVEALLKNFNNMVLAGHIQGPANKAICNNYVTF